MASAFYTFAKADTIYRISFSGGKRDAYVTINFYYRNDSLLYSEMTVRLWNDQTNKDYRVEEYYWKNKLIVKKEMNSFPASIDTSLIPDSLFQEGIKYLNFEKNK